MDNRKAKSQSTNDHPGTKRRIPLADAARRTEFLALLDTAAGAKRLSRAAVGKRVINDHKKWSLSLSGGRAFRAKEFDALMRVIEPAPDARRRMYELHDLPVPAIFSDAAEQLLQKVASQVDELMKRFVGGAPGEAEAAQGTGAPDKTDPANEDEALVAALWKKARDLDWRLASSLRLYDSIADVFEHVGTDNALDARAHVLVLSLFAEATDQLSIHWLYKPSDVDVHIGRIANRMQFSTKDEAERGERLYGRAVAVMTDLAKRYRRAEYLADLTIVSTIISAALEAAGFGDNGQYEELMVLLRRLGLDSDMMPYVMHAADHHDDADRAPGGISLFEWHQRGGWASRHSSDADSGPAP